MKHQPENLSNVYKRSGLLYFELSDGEPELEFIEHSLPLLDHSETEQEGSEVLCSIFNKVLYLAHLSRHES